MAAKSSKNKSSRPRNWFAVAAHFKTGAGKHVDRKKKALKFACRGKVKVDE
jgi:hypothetical protein